MSKTKLLTIEEGNEIRIAYSKIKTKEEIRKIYDGLTEQSRNYTIPVKTVGFDKVQSIISFFEKLENVPFNMTAPFVACYNQLKELTEKDSINYSQIKVIQNMLVGSSWSADASLENPLQEGVDLLNCIKSLEQCNIELGTIEQKIQIAAVREEEINQEIETGLKRKDAANDDTTKMVAEASAEVAQA